MKRMLRIIELSNPAHNDLQKNHLQEDSLRHRVGSSSFAVLFAASVLIVTLTACSGSSNEEYVAVVNGDRIPLEELNTQMSMSNLKFFQSYEDELAARKIITDTLVIQQLLVEEAYKKDFDELEDVARIALSNKEKFLLDALFEREIGSEQDMSESKIQDFFDKLEFKYRASHVLVKTREEADDIMDSLAANAPFGRMAVSFSIDRNSAKDNGDLGYFYWGQMAEPFQRAVIQMSPGDISSPVKTRFGWHIIKLTERLPNTQRTTLQQMRYGIKQDMIVGARNRRVQEYFERMQVKHPITIEEKTVEFIMNKRADLYPPFYLDQLPKNDFDSEQLDRDEAALPLATWDGGQVSLGQYLIMSRSAPLYARPNLDDIEGLETFIFRLKFNEILGLEARRQGLESSEKFKNRIRRFRELTMAEIMRDSIPQPPPPDEDAIIAYYNENQEEFTVPEKLHLYEVLVSDKNQALELRKKIKGLNQMKTIAAELTERAGFRDKRGDLGMIERKWFPNVFDAAKRVAVGGIGGPIKSRLGKWSVFYVVEKRSEEIKNIDAVRRSINATIIDSHKSASFAAWANRVKEEADITIYEDVIKNSIDSDKYQGPTSTPTSATEVDKSQSDPDSSTN
jgi:peptidyl-prolyl cis-trans isomerase C